MGIITCFGYQSKAAGQHLLPLVANESKFSVSIGPTSKVSKRLLRWFKRPGNFKLPYQAMPAPSRPCHRERANATQSIQPLRFTAEATARGKRHWYNATASGINSTVGTNSMRHNSMPLLWASAGGFRNQSTAYGAAANANANAGAV